MNAEDQHKLPADQVTEPNEMRRRMFDHHFLRGDQTLEGKPYSLTQLPNPGHALAKRVLDARQYLGLSGEDAMTVLAYHALLHNERLYAQVIEHMLLVPRIVIADPLAATKKDPT
jgi:hypothetical protein